MASQAAKRPIREFRLGRVKCAIWENDTKDGIRHNISLSRIYKDGNQWRDSTSFGRDDLPLVIKVADMAHTWIYENANSRSEETASNETANAY